MELLDEFDASSPFRCGVIRADQPERDRDQDRAHDDTFCRAECAATQSIRPSEPGRRGASPQQQCNEAKHDDCGDDDPPAGVTAGTDCDDGDSGLSPDTTWYADTDGDGFGDFEVTLAQCDQPAGHVLDSTDCDDTSPTAADTYPGAAGNDRSVACMKDVDDDDWGDAQPPPGVVPGNDCDDDDRDINPTTPW